MKSINLYILILIAPALLFSLRIILIEVAALVSVSNYGKELFWVKSLIGKITGSEIKQSEINEELVSILQMISIMISAGESPMTALKHVANRSEGHLPKLISKSFQKYSDGINLTQTLNFIAVATGSTQVRRLTNSRCISAFSISPPDKKLLSSCKLKYLTINVNQHKETTTR